MKKKSDMSSMSKFGSGLPAALTHYHSRPMHGNRAVTDRGSKPLRTIDYQGGPVLDSELVLKAEYGYFRREP